MVIEADVVRPQPSSSVADPDSVVGVDVGPDGSPSWPTAKGRSSSGSRTRVRWNGSWANSKTFSGAVPDASRARSATGNSSAGPPLCMLVL